MGYIQIGAHSFQSTDTTQTTNKLFLASNNTEILLIVKQICDPLSLMWENLPAGTGTVTVCLFFVWPVPRQSTQGVIMIDPLPPQRRHMLFIMKGPVLIDSYEGQQRWLLYYQHNNMCNKYSERRLTWLEQVFPGLKGHALYPAVCTGSETHHACAIAVVAVRHLCAWLPALPITPWASVINVHIKLLICTLCCLRKC